MQGRVDVLVVDRQQTMAVRRVRKGEEVHAVVVVAGLLELRLPVVAGVGPPGRRVGQHRIAPGEERPRRVARRHQHPVEVRRRLHRHAREAEQRRLGEQLAAAEHAAEQAQRRQAEAALEQVAPALVDQLVETGVAAGVDRLVVVGGQRRVELLEVLGHRDSLQLLGPPVGGNFSVF
ncbi:hypothetical protein D3C78_1037530 [compost metagenome]